MEQVYIFYSSFACYEEGHKTRQDAGNPMIYNDEKMLETSNPYTA